MTEHPNTDRGERDTVMTGNVDIIEPVDGTRVWERPGPLTLGGIVALPLVIAAIVLAFRPWFPTLDMAMTELRVRDVGGRQTPLIGLPGRIGDFPDQGSHPGPWSFWLIRPFHLLSGGRSWGMELGSAVLNSAAAIGAVVVAARVVRRIGAAARPVPSGHLVTLAIAGAVALAIRGYGLSVLTHPWNPYFPLLLWIVILLATWGVLCGEHRLAVVVVGVGTIAAQTHVPYLLLAIAMSSLVVVTLGRRRDGRWLIATVGTAAFLWLPAFVDQIRRDPGNISMLIDHFTGETDEEPIGLVSGTGVFLRHLDLPRAGFEMLRNDAAFLEVSGTTGGVAIGGLIVFIAWLGSVAFAVRHRHAALMRLHTVLAVALAVGWFSMGRIFGKIWYYLTLWAWGTALLVGVSIAWTVAIVVRTALASRSGSSDDATTAVQRNGLRIGWAVLAIPTVLSLAAAPQLQVPEENLSSGLGGVVDETEQALREGVGDSIGEDGRYVVFWQDVNFIGAQGYGLVNELERRGLDVGVHETWRVPVTPQRVLPQGTYDAEVHIVSGEYIDQWRERPGYVEVATEDPRTDDEREEYGMLRERVLERLDEVDRSDIADIIDVNLFGASLDPDLPDDVVEDLERMLVLTAPVAVFIAPPGSTF
ncbi:hypothetical protein [Ilumatobacter nonamiensis]|uniref:hypothetical protein n=1 Tax=Ilumatobacter nonamiensis TaxID=467093 RepID=UPI0003461223|nr:hypothetical protein [Ilumatobacter nonamiensis]